jgi:hypothetical protein
MLRDHCCVTAEDVDKSVREHLDNVAIQAEIKTAVATYARAKEFLTNIRR